MPNPGHAALFRRGSIRARSAPDPWGATLYEGFQSAALLPVASKTLSNSLVVLGTTNLPHMLLKLPLPRPHQQWNQPVALWAQPGRGTSDESNDTALRAAPEGAFICALDRHADQASFAVRHTKVVHVGHTTPGNAPDTLDESGPSPFRAGPSLGTVRPESPTPLPRTRRAQSC